MSSPNKDAAVALAHREFRVFPCNADKTPKGPWASIEPRSPFAISGIWRTDDLPGFPIGKHGMVVIDCDRKPDGPDGVAAFDELCRREGIDRSNAFVVTTPSGGLHFYFRTEVPYGNSSGSLPPGIDVRGKGGYVIAPGAVLPDGRSYRLDHGSWETMPTLPEALASYLKQKDGLTLFDTLAEAPEASGEVLPIPTDGDRTYASAALAGMCDDLAKMGPGSRRNNALTKAAYTMGGYVGSNSIEDTVVGNALYQAAAMNGHVLKHGQAQTETTIQNAINDGRQLPLVLKSQRAVPDIPLLLDVPASPEAPRPLRRESVNGEVFPIEALGSTLHWAAFAIADKIQCPVGMAALSVLGAASLAVQAHGDIVLPASGQVKPLSLFLVSVGDSGERKSAADNEALKAVRMREKELGATHGATQAAYRNIHDAWEAARIKILKGKNDSPHAMANALATLGDEPIAPMMPILTCPEPTFEGLCNLYQSGYPALGLFSDEGGQFVGGHALSADSRLRTIAGLSGLWDGSPIKRVRATREATVILPGRRLAMHLMMQPGVAAGLLSDPILKDQGFLSRLLVSQPPTTTGMRFQRPLHIHTADALSIYTNYLLAILRHPPTTAFGKLNELEPRPIHLDDAARLLWNDYADSIERELGVGGRFESIKRFAGKLPEHATRIAGVLTLFENLSSPFVTVDALQRGIAIANHFASEALRLFDASAVTDEIALAEKLLEWLRYKWAEDFVGLSSIYQYGPNAIRDARTARSVVAVLAEHGWLFKAPAGLW